MWVWKAAFGRPDGTAQELAIVPARHVVTLPDVASFDLGAALGLMQVNARWQFVLIYSAPAVAKAIAVQDICAAVLDGAVGVGSEHGLPLHHFPLERSARCWST